MKNLSAWNVANAIVNLMDNPQLIENDSMELVSTRVEFETPHACNLVVTTEHGEKFRVSVYRITDTTSPMSNGVKS